MEPAQEESAISAIDAGEVDENPFVITRLGTLMEAEPQDPDEAQGVLNPGCTRGRDGQLYLYPREVAQGNCSCIGICRVEFGEDGSPARVVRIGHALEPEESYERVTSALYGCEDARVVYVPALDRYIMTYVALTSIGPRIGLAVSNDALSWTRLGLVDFLLEHDIDLNVYCNKDALLFPTPVMSPAGRPALALIHRPMYVLAKADAVVELPRPVGVDEPRETMWISYADLAAIRVDLHALTHYADHRVLATPQAPWESLKIGGGAPPLLTHLGWLVVYHGVTGDVASDLDLGPIRRKVRYSAGAMVLDRDDPRTILYRSPEPILQPTTRDEQRGVVGSVVFPTGLDPRTPPGPNSRVDVYYGLADTAIGVGHMTLPASLPTRGAIVARTTRQESAREGVPSTPAAHATR